MFLTRHSFNTVRCTECYVQTDNRDDGKGTVYSIQQDEGNVPVCVKAKMHFQHPAIRSLVKELNKKTAKTKTTNEETNKQQQKTKNKQKQKQKNLAGNNSGKKRN